MTGDQTMTAQLESAHFLPVGLERLVGDLAEGVVPDGEQAAFERFGRIWVALFHLSMRSQLLGLQRSYQPFDPDREMLLEAEVSDREKAKLEFVGRVRSLLDRAHFEEATRKDLERALTKTSPLGLSVSVDLGELDVFHVYYRGVEKRTSERRDPWRLWLTKKTEEVTLFRRVFLLLDPKPNPDEGIEAGADGSQGGMDPERIYLKLFKDVPFSDLEMLLPNTKVRMSAFDKLRLAVTGGGGTVGGIMATVTKLGAAASPSTWAMALGGLGAVLWRQLSKVFSQRTKYMATLAKRLYFHTLDNGFGVLTRIMELAEAEECKESLLACAFLARDGESLPADLDERAQAWARTKYGIELDYDVAGGIQKLKKAGVLAGDEGRVAMLGFDAAFAKLDEAWDGVFSAEPEAPAEGA